MDEFQDLLDQLKADFSSKEERKKAIEEKDRLMSEMEFQGRAQHQMSKEFPTYSQLYGNRAIYSPKKDLSGFAENPEIKPILENLQKNPSLQNLNTQSFKLRDLGQNLSAKTLAKDKYNTKDPIDFINQLRLKDKLDYNIGVFPDLLKVKQAFGIYTDDPDEPKKKIVGIDKTAKEDLGTWLHEHLHALNKGKTKESEREALNWLLINDLMRNSEIQQTIADKDINRLRQMLSGGHFMETPNTLPELYVQDEFEDIMKQRGFETRKDPIQSRFKRLKELIRY